jgi:ABC-type transport system involved in multi-copper enzyme maturation permease subunit
MATIQASDVLPVRSRISWGAVMAGAVVALAMYILLMSAGVALGVTVADRVADSSLGIGAGIWSTVAMLLSLFAGGFVASRISVGENKAEAAIYGIVVWGVFFALLLLMTTGVINTGLNAVTGASSAAQAAGSDRVTAEQLEKLGISKAEIDRVKDRLRPTDEQVEEAKKASTAAAWWAFAGLALSMATCVGGALLGAGPNMVITSLRVRAAVVPGEPAEREMPVR